METLDEDDNNNNNSTDDEKAKFLEALTKHAATDPFGNAPVSVESTPLVGRLAALVVYGGTVDFEAGCFKLLGRGGDVAGDVRRLVTALVTIRPWMAEKALTMTLGSRDLRRSSLGKMVVDAVLHVDVICALAVVDPMAIQFYYGPPASSSLHARIRESLLDPRVVCAVLTSIVEDSEPLGKHRFQKCASICFVIDLFRSGLNVDADFNGKLFLKLKELVGTRISYLRVLRRCFQKVPVFVTAEFLVKEIEFCIVCMDASIACATDVSERLSTHHDKLPDESFVEANRELAYRFLGSLAAAELYDVEVGDWVRSGMTTLMRKLGFFADPDACAFIAFQQPTIVELLGVGVLKPLGVVSKSLLGHPDAFNRVILEFERIRKTLKEWLEPYIEKSFESRMRNHHANLHLPILSKVLRSIRKPGVDTDGYAVFAFDLVKRFGFPPLKMPPPSPWNIGVLSPTRRSQWVHDALCAPQSTKGILSMFPQTWAVQFHKFVNYSSLFLLPLILGLRLFESTDVVDVGPEKTALMSPWDRTLDGTVPLPTGDAVEDFAANVFVSLVERDRLAVANELEYLLTLSYVGHNKDLTNHCSWFTQARVTAALLLVISEDDERVKKFILSTTWATTLGTNGDWSIFHTMSTALRGRLLSDDVFIEALIDMHPQTLGFAPWAILQNEKWALKLMVRDATLFGRLPVVHLGNREFRELALSSEHSVVCTLHELYKQQTPSEQFDLVKSVILDSRLPIKTRRNVHRGAPAVVKSSRRYAMIAAPIIGFQRDMTTGDYVVDTIMNIAFANHSTASDALDLGVERRSLGYVFLSEPFHFLKIPLPFLESAR